MIKLRNDTQSSQIIFAWQTKLRRPYARRDLPTPQIRVDARKSPYCSEVMRVRKSSSSPAAEPDEESNRFSSGLN